jgi:broad specificity phosphatase PhoE
VPAQILLVRHGETEWNLQRRIQGRFDSPLTQRGVAQARAVGRLLAAMPGAEGARVITSPLYRARRTAELLSEHLPGAMMELDERLCEISVGCWDGLTYQDIAARSPGVFEGEGRHEWYFHAPGGERYGAFADRIGAWLREAASAAVVVVAVTHGVVSRVMRGLYAGLPRPIALTLPVPQDRIFRLADGAIEDILVPQ